MPLDPSLIASGKPNRRELFETLSDDVEDLQTRMDAAEGVINAPAPIEFGVSGRTAQSIVKQELLLTRIFRAYTIVGIRILVGTAGTTGSHEVDVQYKRGVAAWTSLLTTPLQVAAAAGNYALATGTLAVNALQAGDLLRLNVNAVQTNGIGFTVFVEIEGA